MKIAICGSMTFAKEILKMKKQLEKNGHVCYVPEGVDLYIEGKIKKMGGSEGAKRKKENNLIRKHFDLIKKSDAILVINKDKNGITNYIGGNSFLEIGFAYILGKKIFLMNEIPEIELIKQEIEAIDPIILNGNLEKIKEVAT